MVPIRPTIERYTVRMVVPYSEWPSWIRILVIAPLGFFAGSLMWGWLPKTARQWKFFSAALASFTVFCVLMICVFHYQ
jgi:CHASE2 domain-containing sensor protein